MKVIPPVAITGAMLVNSNVPETDHPEWAAGTTYALGARVIKAATHRVYESAITANVGQDPAAPNGAWFDAGPTNRWAMFDQAMGARSSRTGSITVTLAPGTPITALAVLDADAATVRVQVAGDPYDKTLALAGRAVLTFLDLPGLSANIIVTITGPATVAVGKLLIGNVFELGVTEASPSIGINDFSKRETDEFGVTRIVPRGWAKVATLRSKIPTEDVDSVQRRVAALRARASLWIGEEGYDSLSIYGFFKSFSIDLALPTISFCSFSIEGMAA